MAYLTGVQTGNARGRWFANNAEEAQEAEQSVMQSSTFHAKDSHGGARFVHTPPLPVIHTTLHAWLRVR